MEETITLKRIKNDINGNPRYVVHFLDFISLETQRSLERYHRNNEKATKIYTCFTETLYRLALERARKLGGKIYRGKDFGGGFVFQSYNTRDLIQSIASQA